MRIGSAIAISYSHGSIKSTHLRASMDSLGFLLPHSHILMKSTTSKPAQLNVNCSIYVVHNNLLLSMLSSASHEFEVRAAIISRNCNASRILKNTLTVYGGCYGQLAAFESFVTVLMKCLIALYQLSKAFFTNTNMFLLHDVVFPILRIKEEEMRLFEEDPQEFSRLAEDCCDHQKYGILKTDAAMLLEVIIDENDEAALYVLQHCIISLKVRLGLD